MLELPRVFLEADFVLRPEPPGSADTFALSWPRDTFVAARGAILVGLSALFALDAPVLFTHGHRLEAVIDLAAGTALAFVFHRRFFSRVELILGPHRLAQRITWRGRTRVVEYDPTQPCRLAADRADDDANADVLACDKRGRWRSLYNDDRWRAEIFSRWINAVVQNTPPVNLPFRCG